VRRVLDIRLVLSLALGLAAVRSRAAEALRPLDQVGLEPAEPRIEWKESWQATVEANKKRWTDELQQATKDKRVRDQLLSLRLIHLLEELVKRYPGDAERRRAAYGEIADRLAAAGCRGRANHYLRRIAEEFPGALEPAVAALHKILTAVGDARGEIEGAEDWAHYAVGRLLALHRAGHLLDSHPSVELAWRTALGLALENSRFWEAAQALERLEGIVGRTAWWRTQEAELLLAAGRRDEAVRRLDELAAERVDGRVASLLRELTRERVSEEPEFPRRWALETRWEATRAALDATVVHGLLPEAARTDGLAPMGRGTQASLWALMDRELLALPPATLAPLRELQQREALRRFPVSARNPRAAIPNAEALFGLWRRCPWAAATQGALLASAEQALRRGDAGLAWRGFRDVLAHAADASLRAKAKAGLALVLRHHAPEADAGKAAPPPSSALAPRRHAVVRPPAQPWALGGAYRGRPEVAEVVPEPAGQMVVAGEKLFVAGPSLLACYGAKLSAPLWWRVPDGSSGDGAGPPRRWVTIPGPFAPTVADGLVVTRWGADAARGLMTGLAAFEADTGAIAWSTQAKPWWESLSPITDPAVADGRVYVLAVRGTPTPVAPVWLVCLDAADGALLWQRFLTSCSVGLPRGGGAPRLAAEQVDLAHFGNAPLVHRGAVYCTTNLGFVARCDARDGLVEWVRAYPRMRVGPNLGDAVRRQGATPICCANPKPGTPDPEPGLEAEAVVFAPRDYTGVFALDPATGAVLWDVPFVPSHQVVGVAGGALLLRDEERLVAVQGATGRLLWDRRFPEGMEGRAILTGGEVWLRSGDSLCRIAPDTGRTLERSEWRSREPVRDFVVRGDELVALTDRLAPAQDARHAAPGTPLDVPLRRAWSLRRPDPSLWVPPDGSKLADRVYLLSQGVLECVSRDATRAVHWRRAVPGGVRDTGWAEGLLLLFYSRRVVALDGLAGDLRWQAEVPFDIREWRLCGEHLLLARPKQGRDAAMVRLATGEVVWCRAFADLFGRGHFTLDRLAWDGRQVHLFASRFSGWREGAAELLVRASDGWILGARPFPREGQAWPLQLAVSQAGAPVPPVALITQDKVLHEYSLADGSLRSLPVDLKHLDPKRIQRLAVDEQWIDLYWDKGYDAEPDKHWLVRRGGALVRRKAWGERRGDRLYEVPSGAGTLTVLDLRTGKETACRLPPVPAFGSVGDPLHYHEGADRIFVVTTPQPARAPVVRVDSFRRADGAHLDAQLLPEVEARNNQFVWTPDAVLATDPAGLHCFVAASPTERRARPVQVAYRLPRPLPPGGSLLAAGGTDVVRLSDAGDARGSLYVAHDEENLHVAVRYRDLEATPWTGGASGTEAAFGDWLELGLKTNLGAYRWALGLDRAGKLRLHALGDTPIPRGLRAILQHDPADRCYTCELTLPWKGVLRPEEDWRRIGLWAVAWDDRAASGGGSAPLFVWGRERPEDKLAASPQDTLYLDARTRAQGDGIATVIEELPDLPVSLELFKQDAEMRSASPDELLERYWGFIERHPRGPSAEQLLLETAVEALRGKPGMRGERLLERAAQLGVSEPVRQRVAWQLGAYLSQWVHLGPGKDLRSVLLEFNGGTGGLDAWGYRAYWGKPVANWIVPPCEMGPMAELPEGQWRELRIPMFLVNLHDKPLCGINFCQQGSSRVVWDRTAVVAGGKETVFIEDETPRGTTRGEWDWVAEPRHSGARAHTQPPPPAHYDVRSHTLLALDEPVVAHLSPPLDRPYLSQWVWLDPAGPPTTLAMSLHDGRDWRFRAVWGKGALRGRPMGPLPRPGQWHELRLPLAWTPFLPRSIAGVAFSHVGGRAVWDRTALVAGGREEVLIDDEAPPLRPRPPADGRRAWQSWVDGPGGGTHPVPGKVGLAMACDGHSGYIPVPHSPELDPPQLTVEAWVYLDAFAPGSDTKQWIVNKNGHAWEDGYLGLIIYRDKVVADLNIGGQKENRFEAWSEEGTLKLKQWHHLAMTYDGAALKLYRDAALVAETAVNKERTPGHGALYIGRWAFGRVYFAGALDEVRLYRRALTAPEIQARYADPATLAPQVADAVAAYWGFDLEAAPADPTTEWQWVEQPVKSGKRAHTNRPAAGGCGHAAYVLRDPIVAHLPLDRARAVAVLRAQIPRLGPGGEAWRLFGDLLQLELPNPQRRIELNMWFLAAFPGHPKVADVLGGLLEACTEADVPDPAEQVLALTKDFRLPVETLYHYHRKHARTPREFLRNWQLLGPFAGQGEGWGLETPYPPESDGVKLDNAYPGLGGEARWRAAAAEGSYVNLKFLLGAAENAVAYAAAWVHSDRERPAVFAVGSDDRCKVWLNRKLLLTGQNATYASAGEFIAPVVLAAGWNEVLLKVTQGTGEWGFYFELLDQFARRAPLGVRVIATPPETK